MMAGRSALERAGELIQTWINADIPIYAGSGLVMRRDIAAALTAAEREATERAYVVLDHRLGTFIAGAEFNKETIGAQSADELLAALSLVLTEYRADRATVTEAPIIL